MKQTQLNVIGEDNYFVQEAFKTLRTNLMFCGKDIQVVAVTSFGENEGKTEVSLGLAKSLAELEKKVLYLDADMRKSVVAGRNTTSTETVGLSELLTGIKEIDDCLYNTQYANLQMIFSGQYPPNPVELLNSKYFKNVINHMREYYDYVIVDTPPLGLVIDTAVIAPVVDGTIIVAGNAKLKRKQEMEVVDQLRKADANILGVVRNGTSRKNTKYEYGAYK